MVRHNSHLAVADRVADRVVAREIVAGAFRDHNSHRQEQMLAVAHIAARAAHIAEWLARQAVVVAARQAAAMGSAVWEIRNLGRTCYPRRFPCRTSGSGWSLQQLGPLERRLAGLAG